MKVVLARLEERLLPQHPPGTLKPFKKMVKEMVDTLMKQILAEPPPPAEPTPEEGQPEAAETAEAAAAETEEALVEEDAEAAPEEDAQPSKRRKIAPEESDEEGEPAPAPAVKEEAEGAVDDDDDDLDDDPDAPKVAGKPTHKVDGKVFYTKLTKGDEEIHIGQDVYLENNQDVPYVARLQQIFVYSFAPSEVYFNARWYYRDGDVHEYAQMSGAKGDVEYDGQRLDAHPKELFFSLHMDENHADCILRACSVHLVRTNDDPAGSIWDELTQHEFLAWRAYDNKHVFALTSLPSKKLKDACDVEVKRGPQGLASRAAPAPKKKAPIYEDLAVGPLQNEELLAIWLPRSHLEIWLETPNFQRVVTGTLVRCSQLINGSRTFYAAYVMAIKRMPRAYKLGSKIIDVALQVRTATGNRLIGLDALSNAQCTEAELSKFKVPLDEAAVRKKIRSLQLAMNDSANLFEEEELRRRVEADERLRDKREQEARAKAYAEEERERKERERDEVRRRAAANKQPTEAWWLQYNKGGDDKQREIAKLKARLLRFQKIAESSTADGERENAQRLAEQTELKLSTLTEGD